MKSGRILRIRKTSINAAVVVAVTIRNASYYENSSHTTADDLAEIDLRPGRVDVTSLIQEIFYGLVRRKDNHDLGPQDKRVNGSKAQSAFVQPQLCNVTAKITHPYS
jgi:hypothetical protein